MTPKDRADHLDRLVRYKALTAFKLVAETGSVTGTARRLGVSQPAVTQMIGRLSDYFGFELFERQSQRQLTLSPRGRSVLEGVARCIASMEALADLVDRQGASIAETIVVAVASSLGLRFAQEAIARTAHLFPEVQWRVEPVADADIGAGVVAGDFDIALAAELFGDRALECDQIGILPMVVAMPEHHALTRMRMIRPLDLTNEELALPCSRCVSRGKIDAAFAAAGMQVHAAVEGGTGEATLSFIGAGSRVAVLSGYTTFDMRGDGRVVTRPFDIGVQIDLFILRRRDFHRGDLFLGFRRVCVDLSREIKIG